MPLMMVSFERVAIDIVGPLVQALSRHKFLLILVDYATRYTEAIPLHYIRAEMVAWELAQVFTQTRIPKQVVTNQEASFPIIGIWIIPFSPFP